MTFYRHVLPYLKTWKGTKTRKPLLVRGARQVGKTTLIREFARSYDHSILLNLERPAHRSFFESFRDVRSISEALFLAHKIPAEATGRTLLFIDEIQESPDAIQLLRYFHEDVPDLHVVAAGSLLEFAARKVESFPVGRVEFLYIHPMNFPEYLRAAGNGNLIDHLSNIPVSPVAHKVLLDLFHRYAIIGGMPEVVNRDLEEKNLAQLPTAYESIWETYKQDVEKYTTHQTARRIVRHILETAPLYIDQRIKFQGFGNSDYRSREVGEAFRTLEESRVLRLIYPTTDLEAPVKADLKKSPRLQLLDTGLVNHALGMQSQMLGMNDLSTAYRGAIVPHLVTQELISLSVLADRKPNFWVREKKQSSAEVDLLFASNERMIPIEIKSGSTGSLKSLHQFVEASGHPYAIRMYGGAFGVQKAKTPNGKQYLLMNLPYYLGARLPEYIEWFMKHHAL